MNKKRLRILYLLDTLLKHSSEQNPLSINQLIDALDQEDIPVERKALYEDINALKDYGHDIEYIHNKGYYITSRLFDLAEIKIIADILQSSTFISSKKTQTLIKKLTKDQNQIESNFLLQQPNNENKTKHEQILYNIDTLLQAIIHNKTILFKYFDYHLNKTKTYRKNAKNYKLIPKALLFDNNQYYLIGYNETYQTLLNFRVDRLDHIQLTNSAAPIDLDIQTYIQQNFNMYHGSLQTITLKCKHHLSNTILDKFNQSLIIKDYDNLFFTINVKVPITPTFLAWLFQFKDDIQLLQPQSVIEEYKDYLQTILSSYK
ncbi:WYL domain-containing transcriptional regulator [Erysipelotrichaceae bacterium OH741_COT-311]|nr:WYL domain-containing transcriptional regulator [Erysipelotrichaceae bacterium OH741_COT-311]